MKTNMIKTATLTLAMVISMSVNAQNTKSLKENQFTKKLDKIVKENLADLTHTLNTLKSSVQFKPEANPEFATESNEAVVDLKEFESIVKYIPSANIETSEVTEDNGMEAVLAELKEIVKYKPQSESTLIESELKKATEELALVVRFKPAS